MAEGSAMADGETQGRPALRVLAGGRAAEGDGELLGEFLGGDDAAFEELWRRHHATVHALVRRYARTPEDARDLTQRAFLRAVGAARRAVRQVRAEEFPFRPWLLRIAANLGKNHLRDEARWRLAPVSALEDAADGAAPADELLARREREQRVRTAVLRLPRRQREVLTLRIDAGLAFAEVARTLGIAEGNARVHFHHAVRRLAELVRGAGEDAP
jgi:RNA polymerase sigma-70 factor (ECF subfamily)